MRGIAAVVLAAGDSSRLGEPKQFLEYGGEALVHRIARLIGEAGCSPIVVVAGAAHLEIAAALGDLKVHVIEHPDWARGMGSSIRAGVRAVLKLAPELDAILFAVCDQPFVTVDVLTRLIQERKRTAKLMSASFYAGTAGVPAIFDRKLLPRILALPDRGGARQLFELFPGGVALLDFPAGLADIDTPSDRDRHL